MSIDLSRLPPIEANDAYREVWPYPLPAFKMLPLTLRTKFGYCARGQDYEGFEKNWDTRLEVKGAFYSLNDLGTQGPTSRFLILQGYNPNDRTAAGYGNATAQRLFILYQTRTGREESWQDLMLWQQEQFMRVAGIIAETRQLIRSSSDFDRHPKLLTSLSAGLALPIPTLPADVCEALELLYKKNYIVAAEGFHEWRFVKRHERRHESRNAYSFFCASQNDRAWYVSVRKINKNAAIADMPEVIVPLSTFMRETKGLAIGSWLGGVIGAMFGKNQPTVGIRP